MSEFVRKMETEPTVEAIADGLEHWVMKEVGSSFVGRNHVLDDFRDWRGSLSLPYDDPGNFNARKNKKHHSQLINWTNGLVEFYDGLTDEQADYMLARQMFRAQMYLSGLFRVACFMRASDQEDYCRRRLDQRDHVGLDVDPRTPITDRLYRLYDYVPDSDGFRPKLTLPDLAARTLDLNEEQQGYVKELHVSGRDDVGQEESPTIDMIVGMEKKWIGHLVDYIAFVASERGGHLAAVPFLEPKSISDDPQPYYPFADQA